MNGTGKRGPAPAPRDPGLRNKSAGAPEDPLEMAAYIAEITLEMRNMATNAGLPFLAYLLEMAFQEAFDLSQGEASQAR